MNSTDAKKGIKSAELRGDFLAGLLDSTNLVVYLKDIEGRYIYVNRRYERLSTFPRSMLLGKRDHDFFVPAVADLFRAQDAQVIAHGGPLEFEETIPLPGGELSFITEKFPLRGEDGAICGVGGFCTEITSQKNRAAETQAEVRERLAVTMRSISEGVVSTDTGGLVTMINAAGEALTGLKQSEAAGRCVDEVLPASDKRKRGAFGLLVSRALKAGQGLSPAKDISIAVRGGGAHIVVPSVSAVRDRRGAIIGTVISLRDVTQSRGLEAESRRLASRILKNREEEKKRFTACLQESISALQSEMSSLLMRTETDIRSGRQQQALAKLEQARKLLRDSTSEVKGACIENWTHSLAIPGLDPAIRELLSRFCARSNIRVLSDIRLPENAPAPESSLAALLYRVSREALANTEKHSGAKKLEFSLAYENGWLTLAARDDGRGFDAARVPKRAGFGLKEMAEEVKAAGGRFSVQSKPGRGTLLKARLPFRQEE